MIQKFTDERVFMNTKIRITVYSDAGTVATREQINIAYSKFDEVVRKYTRFKETSELAVLNSNQGKAHRVSAEFFQLVKYMLDLAETTKGVFDPTIIDLLEAYGYDAGYHFAKLDDPGLNNEIAKLVKSRPSWRDIELDEEKLTIQLAPKQRLDLGSVGKGFAIDLAYDALNVFESFIINAGGDVKAKGTSPARRSFSEGGWTVGLEQHPLPNRPPEPAKIIGSVELHDQALAGSGGWARRVKFFHHLLDPQTGLPRNEVSQSFVLAPTALDADAWATTLFFLGKPGLKLLESQNLEGLLIDLDGEIIASDNLSLAI
jgi:thiamine biosynthesis lipoprotein